MGRRSSNNTRCSSPQHVPHRPNVDKIHTKRRRSDKRAHELTRHIDVIDDFAAIRAMRSENTKSHSGGRGTTATPIMQVYEWMGDAVIGELVARCLLAQFHQYPLSARVFRNLRLGIVTNHNLSMVFDHMGYNRQGLNKVKVKDKADVVEAIAGEIIVRLEMQQRDSRTCTQLRCHLDAMVASMMHQHFAERKRIHERAKMSGPLTESFNAFSCLPQEYLDEVTGELGVHEGGVVDDWDAQLVRETQDTGELGQKSFKDLIDECDVAPDEIAQIMSFHALAIPCEVYNENALPFISFNSDGMNAVIHAIRLRVESKLRGIPSNHILRSSREFFDVFRIYGMAVLAECVSLSIAYPCFASNTSRTRSDDVTPASLTMVRQSVLCVSNLAQCATFLGLVVDNAVPVSDAARERLFANSLRAFVGFHTAFLNQDRHNDVAHDVAFVLQLIACQHYDTQKPPRYPSPAPVRQPLSVLKSAVRTAYDFLSSAVCDDMHHLNERPMQSVSKSILVQDVSGKVENIFDTFTRQREQRGRQLGSNNNIYTRKRKRSVDVNQEETDHSKPSANLARFTHRRFLFCLEELVVLFAQRKTEECRSKMVCFEKDLEPCAGEHFRKWEVSSSTLTFAMRDGFFRLLLHDLCSYHSLVSSSKNTRDGTRITQLRLPLHYSWSKIARRAVNEEEAVG